MSKDNGGPAFPLADSNAEYMNTSRQECNGISKREFFAAKALPGFLATCEREPGGATSTLSAEAIARACYEMADAMIAEGLK